MTVDQRQLVLDLITNSIDECEFLSRFGHDLRSDPQVILTLLQRALQDRSPDDAECAIHLVNYFGLSDNLVPTLNMLLNENWHCRHEDIAGALQLLHDPRSVDSLYRAAETRFAYLDYDEHFGLARKCTWALSDIGTTEAREKLALLATSQNPQIAAYARKRLSSSGRTPN